ncbi:hypothetical protein N0V86_009672 [Didymella sp. IMI 355093]|nr:hypothetical protein N0V86_009672 [Didymella sp. IMI 355093]
MANPSYDTMVPPFDKQDLYEIADKLLAHRTYGPPKPEPIGQPTVWADARMDLCETLHYFRSYQGACYSIGGFVRGFMFDKVAHPRDYIDSDVVIARAGGGQVKDKDSGELKASGDQVEGNTSQNLRNCMAHYNPVVIITGADNPHMPSQPPHQYCVLDYFKPTHIWTEKSGKSNIVRYRFEKLNARKPSWWSSQNQPDTVSLGSLPPPFARSCGTCAKESTQVYVNGWMCLSPTCPSFWLILPSSASSPHTSPREPDEADLVYDPRFLKAHIPWPNDDHDYPLKPSTISLSQHAVPGEDTSEAFTRGLSHASSATSPSSDSDDSTPPLSPSAHISSFTTHPFNEVLALCYFESQRISYHDDGEFGLGPTIATLSLGAPGHMRIRLKQKHHLGVSAAGVYTDVPPVPGCMHYAPRRALVSELRDLKARVSATEYRKRLKEVPKQIGLKTSGNAKDVLCMRVAHGDIVVMHGEALQRYYEHSVEHAGKLRFALTSRFIDPDSLAEGEKPGYEVGDDEGGYDGSLLGGRVKETQGRV